MAQSSADRAAVVAAGSLSAPQVYQVVLREGEEELGRPVASLIWSGIAAGICISFSVIGEAIFRANLPPADWSHLVENLGYSFGFLLVVLGRMQLFTENTITTVIPVLARRSLACTLSAARLWAVVLTANVVGAFIAATFIAHAPVFDAEMHVALKSLSEHATGAPALTGFAKGIPAGILVAALVWMLSSGSKADPFLMILAFTWAIAAGDFTHIVAGSVKMAYLIVTGNLGAGPAIGGFFVPVFLGNVVGGTAVFTLMAWGQVREEVQD